MTPDEFWKGDPRLTIAYRDAARRKVEEQNGYLWLQGRYFSEALSTVMHNSFSKKGTKALEYPNEPHRITPLTEEEKKAKAEAERRKAIKSLTAWKAAWDKVYG